MLHLIMLYQSPCSNNVPLNYVAPPPNRVAHNHAEANCNAINNVSLNHAVPIHATSSHAASEQVLQFVPTHDTQ